MWASALALWQGGDMFRVEPPLPGHLTLDKGENKYVVHV